MPVVVWPNSVVPYNTRGNTPKDMNFRSNFLHKQGGARHENVSPSCDLGQRASLVGYPALPAPTSLPPATLLVSLLGSAIKPTKYFTPDFEFIVFESRRLCSIAPIQGLGIYREVL